MQLINCVNNQQSVSLMLKHTLQYTVSYIYSACGFINLCYGRRWSASDFSSLIPPLCAILSSAGPRRADGVSPDAEIHLPTTSKSDRVMIICVRVYICSCHLSVLLSSIRPSSVLVKPTQPNGAGSVGRSPGLSPSGVDTYYPCHTSAPLDVVRIAHEHTHGNNLAERPNRMLLSGRSFYCWLFIKVSIKRTRTCVRKYTKM
jgi:hypothetical protein